jgi:hypothetical protein
MLGGLCEKYSPKLVLGIESDCSDAGRGNACRASSDTSNHSVQDGGWDEAMVPPGPGGHASYALMM